MFRVRPKIGNREKHYGKHRKCPVETAERRCETRGNVRWEKTCGELPLMEIF